MPKNNFWVHAISPRCDDVPNIEKTGLVKIDALRFNTINPFDQYPDPLPALFAIK